MKNFFTVSSDTWLRTHKSAVVVVAGVEFIVKLKYQDHFCTFYPAKIQIICFIRNEWLLASIKNRIYDNFSMLELHRSTPATTTTVLLCERNHVSVHTVEKIFIKQFIISQSYSIVKDSNADLTVGNWDSKIDPYSVIVLV